MFFKHLARFVVQIFLLLGISDGVYKGMRGCWPNRAGMRCRVKGEGLRGLRPSRERGE